MRARLIPATSSVSPGPAVITGAFASAQVFWGGSVIQSSTSVTYTSGSGPISISVIGTTAEYRINSGAWTSASGQLLVGDVVTSRMTAPVGTKGASEARLVAVVIDGTQYSWAVITIRYLGTTTSASGGTTTWTVPTGVTSITGAATGGGGGGGVGRQGNSSLWRGGGGGGGGAMAYSASIAVSAGQGVTMVKWRRGHCWPCWRNQHAHCCRDNCIVSGRRWGRRVSDSQRTRNWWRWRGSDSWYVTAKRRGWRKRGDIDRYYCDGICRWRWWWGWWLYGHWRLWRCGKRKRNTQFLWGWFWRFGKRRRVAFLGRRHRDLGRSRLWKLNANRRSGRISNWSDP